MKLSLRSSLNAIESGRATYEADRSRHLAIGASVHYAVCMRQPLEKSSTNAACLLATDSAFAGDTSERPARALQLALPICLPTLSAMALFLSLVKSPSGTCRRAAL